MTLFSGSLPESIQVAAAWAGVGLCIFGAIAFICHFFKSQKERLKNSMIWFSLCVLFLICALVSGGLGYAALTREKSYISQLPTEPTTDTKMQASPLLVPGNNNVLSLNQSGGVTAGTYINQENPNRKLLKDNRASLVEKITVTQGKPKIFINYLGSSTWYVPVWEGMFEEAGWNVVGSSQTSPPTIPKNQYYIEIKVSLFDSLVEKFTAAGKLLNEKNPELNIYITSKPDSSNSDVSFWINMVE